MPLNYVKQDGIGWADAELAGQLGLELHTTPDGGLELLRDCLAHNQYALDIDDFGDALGYPIGEGLPANPTGHHVFSTELDGSTEDQRRQSLTAQDIAEPFFDFATPFVDSGSRPLRDALRTDPGLRYRPPPPIMESVPVENKGFPGGNRQLFLTRVNPKGNLHSDPSEPVDFFLSEGEGLKVKIPRGPAHAAPASGGPGTARIKVGIWVTEVDGGSSTARLQDTVAHDAEEVILTEFKRGRKFPTSNETRLSPPPEVRPRHINKRRADGTLRAREYRFVRWYHTAFGITVASRATYRRVEHQDQKNRALYVSAPPRRKGATHWSLGVIVDGVGFVARRPAASGIDATRLSFTNARSVPVNGDFGASEGEQSLRGKRFTFDSSGDFPRENTSGIEGIDSAPDAPEPVDLGGTRPPAGTRFYSYADVISTPSGEQMSLPSNVVEHTTVFGEIARMRFPDPNNLLQNAEGRVLRANGRPEGWTIAGANGAYEFDAENVTHILTTGGLSFATGTVSATLPDEEINPQQDYCAHPFVAAGIQEGTAEMVFLELDSAGNTLGTITVVSLSATGAEEPVVRMGPNTSRPFTANTVKVRPRVRMTGASRNMTIWFANLSLHPYIMAPRKVQEGEPRTPAEFNNSPALPYPRGVVHAVGPAPQTQTELTAPETIEPLYDFNFTDGSITSLPPGGSGWSHQKSQAAVVSEIRPPSHAAPGWFVSDSTSNHTAHARLFKNLDAEASGSALSILFVQQALGLPGGTNNVVDLARMDSQDGLWRVRLYVHSTNNRLRMLIRDNAGKTTELYPGVEFNKNDQIEAQVIADRVGTNNGRVRLEIGKNGGSRVQRAELTGIKWNGLALSRPYGGAIHESNNNTAWAFLTKRLTVTDSDKGFQGRATEITIPENISAEPDRPYEPSTDTYRSHSEEGEIINQDYLFIPKGTPRFSVPYFAKWAVLPGRQYRFSIFARHEVPVDEGGSQLWYLTLHNVITGEIIEIGSPYGDGAEGISGWSERAGSSFIVPAEEGWTELRVSHRDVGPGLFLGQEWAYSQGTVVKRGYGVAQGGAPGGAFLVDLDSRTPGGEPIPPARFTGKRLALGLIASELPDGTSVDATFRGSDDGENFTPALADPDEVPERNHYRIAGTLAGDGRLTPYIAHTGPHVATTPLFAQLLREDGSELPGGVLVNKLSMPPRRRWYETSTVSGNRHAIDVTEPVMWTSEVTLIARTEDAMNEINENWEGVWRIEAPRLLNGRGANLMILFGDEVTMQEEDLPYVYKNGHRWLEARAEGVRAQVIDMGLLT